MTHLKKHLGQHILQSPAILKKIVEAAEVGPGERILEIGPGPGNLTRQLAEAVGPGGHVLSVELDRDWTEALGDVCRAHPCVHVAWGDALSLDLEALLASSAGTERPWKVVANIPYYITAPLIERLLDLRTHLSRLALLMQREVAVRVAAERGRDVGSISHFVRYHALPRVAFTVPAGAFVPPPQVESALLVLDVRERPPVDAPPGLLFRLIRTTFGTRRKMLRKSMRALPLLEETGVERALAAAGVAGEKRPEELSLDDFSRLACACEPLMASPEGPPVP